MVVAASSSCDETLLFGLERSGEYRGCQNITHSGKTCQQWSAQTPHEHGNSPEARPGKGLGDHNYCRNPDGEPSIWCYTTDATSRWELCSPLIDTPKCSSYTWPKHTIGFLKAVQGGMYFAALGRPAIGSEVSEAQWKRAESLLPSKDLAVKTQFVHCYRAVQIHMFEGASCANASDPLTKSVTKSLEMNKCTSIEGLTVKVTEKDASSVYLMMGQTEGCSDGEGTWGTGNNLDCKNDASECCDVSQGGSIMFSYKIGPPASPPSPAPVPTPVPTPVPAPTSLEQADIGNGQAPGVLIASAVAGLGALILDAA